MQLHEVHSQQPEVWNVFLKRVLLEEEREWQQWEEREREQSEMCSQRQLEEECDSKEAFGLFISSTLCEVCVSGADRSSSASSGPIKASRSTGVTTAATTSSNTRTGATTETAASAVLSRLTTEPTSIA